MIKRILKTVAVMTSLLCMTMCMAACGEKESKVVSYKVSVVDALGSPYTSGVVVKFLKSGEQVAMQVCNESGVATKELAKGTYDVEVSFTSGDENYYYETGKYKVTATKPEVSVVVAQNITTEPGELYVNNESYDAYSIGTGCTYVKLQDERNYFLFKPVEAGTYEVSVAEGNIEGIGYYGAPHYVQKESAAEVVDNKFKISISNDMIGADQTGTTVIVIGIDKAEDSACIVGIERIGDPEYSVANEPWTIYNKTVELNKYVLPEGAKLTDFDLTADSYELVLNNQDGFYHLNTEDGPVVLMKLGKDSKYLACFKTILDRSGVCKYFFEEDGTFIKKESYSECLLEYINYIDEESGTYPLTEDLKYILMQRGDYVGWWKPESSLYLFVDEAGFRLPDINSEIAWLFMCCYIEE